MFSAHLFNRTHLASHAPMLVVLVVLAAIATISVTAEAASTQAEPDQETKLFFVADTRLRAPHEEVDGREEDLVYKKHVWFDVMELDQDQQRVLLRGKHSRLSVELSRVGDKPRALGHLRRVRWDYGNDQPVTAVHPRQRTAFVGWASFAQYLYQYWMLWTALFGAFWFVCRQGEASKGQRSFLITSGLIAGLLGFVLGHDDVTAMQNLTAHLTSDQARSSEGHILPFAPTVRGPSNFSFYLFIPIFLVACSAICANLGAFVRGIYYLFVPHPVEAHLPSTSTPLGRIKSIFGDSAKIDPTAVASSVPDYDVKNPPPAWKSRKDARRLRELNKLMDEENQLMKTVEKRGRRDHGLDD